LHEANLTAPIAGPSNVVAFPDDNWLRDRGFRLNDDSGRQNYSPAQKNDIRAAAEWLDAKEMIGISANGLQVVLGKDEFFSSLREVKNAIEADRNSSADLKLTPSVAARMLLEGYAPNQLLKSVAKVANEFIRVYKKLTILDPVLLDPPTEAARTIGNALLAGKSFDEIARAEWDRRVELYRNPGETGPPRPGQNGGQSRARVELAG
jgi:hypothetical protein